MNAPVVPAPLKLRPASIPVDPAARSDGTFLRGVRLAELGHFWPTAAEYLARVIPRHSDTASLEDVQDLLTQGLFQLWIVYKEHSIAGACVTERVNAPRYRYLNVLYVSGELDIFDHIIELAEWARRCGCRKIVAQCRPGVAVTIAKKYGFKERHRLMDFDLWEVVDD